MLFTAECHTCLLLLQPVWPTAICVKYLLTFYCAKCCTCMLLFPHINLCHTSVVWFSSLRARQYTNTFQYSLVRHKTIIFWPQLENGQVHYCGHPEMVKTHAFCKLLNEKGLKFFNAICWWSFFQIISPLQASLIFSLLSISKDQKRAVSFTLQMVSLALLCVKVGSDKWHLLLHQTWFLILHQAWVTLYAVF
jgi:hypothetical protein